MSCRIKHIKAMEKAVALRFPCRSEHWVGINNVILENYKCALDMHSKQTLGKMYHLTSIKIFIISTLNNHWL